MQYKSNLERIFWLVTLAFISVVFLLVCSPFTSPLTDNYGYDSAFFILVGRGMTEGMLPYRDFFDMKGPYLFLIEYIGQLLVEGRTGAFIMQCVNLFFTLYLIDKICCINMKISIRKKDRYMFSLTCILACLYIMNFTFEGGNLTEEYSLPLLLCALYLMLKYMKSYDQCGMVIHPISYGFYYGFAFGVLALVRITNASLIGAIIFTVTVFLICSKEFKNLFFNGIAFVAGCIVAFLPICVFYAKENLLAEMLSQVFLFGIQYSAESSMVTKFVYILETRLPCILLMFFPVLALLVNKCKEWKKYLFCISAFVFLLAAVSMGNGYLHYFTLLIPNFVLGFVLFLCGEKYMDLCR